MTRLTDDQRRLLDKTVYEAVTRGKAYLRDIVPFTRERMINTLCSLTKVQMDRLVDRSLQRLRKAGRIVTSGGDSAAWQTRS